MHQTCTTVFHHQHADNEVVASFWAVEWGLVCPRFRRQPEFSEAIRPQVKGAIGDFLANGCSRPYRVHWDRLRTVMAGYRIVESWLARMLSALRSSAFGYRCSRFRADPIFQWISAEDPKAGYPRLWASGPITGRRAPNSTLAEYAQSAERIVASAWLFGVCRRKVLHELSDPCDSGFLSQKSGHSMFERS
jgi:hypothetical protein